MKIGLYFGTFDPIHIGHATVANQVYSDQKVDEVWFVVTPRSPEKNDCFLTSKEDRFNMVNLVVSEMGAGFKVTDVEYALPSPQYTADTLIHLINCYPNYSFSLIMGADNYLKLHTWHRSSFIIKNFTKYVYMRQGANIKKIHSDTILLLGSAIDVSSTIIRKNVHEGGHYLHKGVLKYIVSKKLYII
mgnify:CR=1 FL=1